MRVSVVISTLVALFATSALGAPTAITARDIQAIIAREDISNLTLREVIESFYSRGELNELSARKDLYAHNPAANPNPPPAAPAQGAAGQNHPNQVHVQLGPGATVQPGPAQQAVVTHNNPAGGVQPQQGQTGTWPGRRDLLDLLARSLMSGDVGPSRRAASLVARSRLPNQPVVPKPVGQDQLPPPGGSRPPVEGDVPGSHPGVSKPSQS
ncbi:hypothetical protein EIP91_007384 [Steccherinum ochraceum]|uniref:Uncharacterized protein n=1 Tax=Steccherinum ochraceum TaxID=92696 RepID=A0A4V2MXW2_9APHY|nr:hypothetical protein EIP91_007384 [Steccherinum ochraceum]